MAEPLEEMGAFFNDRAKNYNTAHLEYIGGIESKHVIASFLPDNAEAIIDLGIGTGLELEAIFKRFPDINVTGLDLADNMLKILRESYPDKNIELHCASYLDYDLGICRYDAALSVMTLHHYGYKEKAALYHRIYNCIKPGGLYIECDYMLSLQEYANAQEMEDSYFSEFERLKNEQGITDGTKYHYDTPCTVSNQTKMLLTSGFKDVKEVWRQGNTVILMADK